MTADFIDARNMREPEARFRVLRAPRALSSVMLIGHGQQGYTLDHPVLIETDAQARHIYIIGATGSGKTALLETMIADQLAGDEGVCFIDPHGDAAERLPGFLPLRRRDHLVYLDLADDRPIGLNFITGIPAPQRPTAAANIHSAFIHIWGEQSIGARSQQVLRNSVRLLMDAQGGTLVAIPRLLADSKYRDALLRTATDPVVRAYWTHQFDHYDDRKRDDVISPILNKLDAFLSYPSLRAILGQTRNTIELRRIMDEGRVLIVNLRKGMIGDPALIFASLLFSALAQTALARAGTPEAQRSPFYVFADEFQNYATVAIATTLSELRKYAFHLTLAHQYLHQLAPEIRHAVLGNVGTLISFRVGAEDSDLLAKHFDINDPHQLQDLPNYRAYLRPLQAGTPANARLFKTLPPPTPLHRKAAAASLIDNSRVRFGRDRATIEAKLSSFLSQPSRPASVSKRRSSKRRPVA